MAATIDRATAEQARCEAAASKAQREMRQLLSQRGSPDVSSGEGLLTAATAAAMIDADATGKELAEPTAVADRAAKLRSFSAVAGLPAESPRLPQSGAFHTRKSGRTPATVTISDPEVFGHNAFVRYVEDACGRLSRTFA